MEKKEKTGVRRLNQDVPEDLHRRVRIYAAQKGIRLAPAIKELLEVALDAVGVK